MCIVSFAWKAHPRWKFVAIGNRDELHARPADPITRWPDPDHLLAGRDIKAGGTWLGISEQGRFAVVTNLAGHGEPNSKCASRGGVLRDFLSGDGEYSDIDNVEFSAFNPFNLITIADDQARIHTNRPGASSDKLVPGIYGLSNGALDDPWPKSPHLNQTLETWVSDGAENPILLLDILLDKTAYQVTADDKQLSLEPRQSPIFICSPVYGTRCSTIVAVDDQNQGLMIERCFAPSGEQTGETRLSFIWPE
ncbi:Uncharacterized NRDE family protein [hydrothermal vent metagenome]|uniref:Uncharacterized NRDE family protein n=1 Tax=hydrothermal vent metagenome TaxID=652676 RepID=A0A3B0SEG7_9ZZZZ